MYTITITTDLQCLTYNSTVSSTQFSRTKSSQRGKIFHNPFENKIWYDLSYFDDKHYLQMISGYLWSSFLLFHVWHNSVYREGYRLLLLFIIIPVTLQKILYVHHNLSKIWKKTKLCFDMAWCFRKIYIAGTWQKEVGNHTKYLKYKIQKTKL